MQQNAKDTDEQFGKLIDEYKGGSESIITLKDKYQGMQSVLCQEETQIKHKNAEISKLQEELHELQQKAENTEGQVRRKTQEIDSFI